ncbi:MAG TPA: hypothetical protein VEA69_15605 [Tepidisphaeraceae bacterium]|nr:hypothetical protein [Tepidisphaeraceae bacterium]
MWPANVGVARSDGSPALVLAVHPRCPCSRATIGELAKLMTDCRGRVTATVLMLRPAGVPAGWERTGLWDAAAAIPGVTVVADDAGRAAGRFGAATSGQALLYGADGRLLFAGGITESRGHSGDNAGRSALTASILGGAPTDTSAVVRTPVYGCPLFDLPTTCTSKEGPPACHTK